MRNIATRQEVVDMVNKGELIVKRDDDKEARVRYSIGCKTIRTDTARAIIRQLGLVIVKNESYVHSETYYWYFGKKD